MPIVRDSSPDSAGSGSGRDDPVSKTDLKELEADAARERHDFFNIVALVRVAQCEFSARHAAPLELNLTILLSVVLSIAVAAASCRNINFQLGLQQTTAVLRTCRILDWKSFLLELDRTFYSS